MAARRVAWRSTAPRRAPANTWNLRSRRWRSSAGLIAMTRAAANSMASGTPSRRWQASTTERALLLVKAKSALTCRARSTNKLMASARRRRSTSSLGSPTASGGSAISCSPSIAMPSRLVASTTTPGHSRSMRVTSRATAPSTCSQLSSTNSNCFWDSISMRESSEYCPPGLVTRNTAATAAATPSGSRTGASSTSHAPSRYLGSTSAATCNAKRVLPTPPTPVTVTTRDVSRAFATRDTSFFRPMNELTCAGRFPGNESSVRSGGSLADHRPGSVGRSLWDDQGHAAGVHRDRRALFRRAAVRA